MDSLKKGENETGRNHAEAQRGYKDEGKPGFTVLYTNIDFR